MKNRSENILNSFDVYKAFYKYFYLTIALSTFVYAVLVLIFPLYASVIGKLGFGVAFIFISLGYRLTRKVTSISDMEGIPTHKYWLTKFFVFLMAVTTGGVITLPVAYLTTKFNIFI